MKTNELCVQCDVVTLELPKGDSLVALRVIHTESDNLVALTSRKQNATTDLLHLIPVSKIIKAKSSGKASPKVSPLASPCALLRLSGGSYRKHE